MPTEEFKKSLAVGQLYEMEVCEWVSLLFDRKFRLVDKDSDGEWYKFFDLVEDTGKRRLDISKDITVECKYSSKESSPNIVVEFSSYREKPSCISTSLATYFVFNIGSKFHLIVSRADLIRAIIKDLCHEDPWKKIRSDEYDKKRILYIPTDYLLQECVSAEKHVRTGGKNSGNGRKRKTNSSDKPF
ncbi:MAG: hypothetical protein ACW99U_12765 [Candidatus Thorarchaeota archaeon]|jgi:hypothetical protein